MMMMRRRAGVGASLNTVELESVRAALYTYNGWKRTYEILSGANISDHGLHVKVGTASANVEKTERA